MPLEAETHAVLSESACCCTSALPNEAESLTAFLESAYCFNGICNEVAPFDNAVIDRLIELHSKTGRDICDLLKTHEIQQMLLSNRMKMNTDKGYRILAPNMSKIKKKKY